MHYLCNINDYDYLILTNMKTKVYLLCAMALLLAQAAKAQMWMGGSVGFDYSSSEKKNKITTLTLSPTVGYSLNPKWDLGVELSYGFTQDKTDDLSAHSVMVVLHSKDVTNSITVEPFVRYSFLKTGIVTFFVDGGFGFTYAKRNKDYSKEETAFVESIPAESINYTLKGTSNAFSIGLRPGVKIELTEKIEIESHLGFIGYSHKKSEDNMELRPNTHQYDESSVDKFGFNANCTALNLGLTFKF